MIDIFDALKNEAIDPLRAHEMNSAAGKVTGFVNLELKYAKMRGEVPDIPFLNVKDVNEDGT